MHTPCPPRARRGWRPGLLGLALLTLLSGCWSRAPKPESPEALRLQANLLRFSQYYAASIGSTADEIAEKTEEREVREMTLRWKIAAIPIMRTIVNHEDPRYALIDAWMVVLRQRINLDEGSLKSVFGAQQPLAVATLKLLEARIEDIARGTLDPDALAQAEAELEAFARGQPLEGKFTDDLVHAATRVSENAHPSIFHLLSIPIGGLSETADSIARLAAVGEVFTEVVNGMPERLRWETQLFMLEAARTGTLATALEDFERLSLAVEAFSETAKNLPAQLRGELETLLSSADTTLAAANALVADTRGLMADTRAMLSELEAPLAATTTTSEELTRAGSAWTSAGTNVNEAMTTISNMGGDDPPPAGAAAAGTANAATPASDDSFKMSDLTDAGNSIDAAATELRALLGDLESDQTEASLDQSLDAAARRLEELVDTITLRALYVLGVLLVGWFVIRRCAPRSKASQAT